MIIKEIPESVYIAALKERDVYYEPNDNWSAKQEYDLLVDKSGWSEGELERAIADYLVRVGEWREE